MKNKRNIFVIILIIIALCLIISAIIFCFCNTEKKVVVKEEKYMNYDKKYSKEMKQVVSTDYVAEDLEKLIKKYILNDNVTMEMMQKSYFPYILNKNIILGKDSFLLNSPSKDDITLYKLDNLYALQKKYAEKVMNEWKSNLKYEFLEINPVVDNRTVQKIKFSTMYYGMYYEDLTTLTEKIYNNEYKDSVKKSEEDIYTYRSGIIAMSILNDNLDFYKNSNNEELETYVFYKGSVPADDNELHNLIVQFGGFTYSNSTLESDDAINAKNERINNYLKLVNDKMKEIK